MRTAQAVGRFGEDVAARHLVEAGIEVVERNWRCSAGEIDLVALDHDELVVVEVKTRRSQEFGGAVEAVTRVKLRRLRRLAAQWLAVHDLRPASVRIDVVAVTVPRQGAVQVEHLVGVV